MTHLNKILTIVLILLSTIETQARLENLQHYIQKANQHVDNELYLAEQYLDSCKPFINSVKDKKLVSHYYMTSAKIDLFKGDFEKSIYILEKTINNLKYDKQESDLAQAQFLLSTAYFYQSNYTEAAKLAIESKTYYDTSNDSTMIIRCANLIGTIFFYLDQYYLASQYYKQVEDYAIRKNNDSLLLVCQNNLAGLFMTDSIKNIPMAISYYESAIKIAKRIKKSTLPNMYSNLGSAYIEIKNFNKADHYLNLALQQDSNNNAYLQSKVFYNLAIIAEQNQQFTKAKEFFEKSTAESLKTHDFAELKETYEKLSEIEMALSNFKNAINYLKLSDTYNDSISALEKTETINRLHLQYKLDQEASQKELNTIINRLLHEKSIGMKFRKLGLFAFITMSLLLFILRYNYSRKQKATILNLKKANDKLNEKNSELDNTIKTRDKLIYTIAHDIKNPLGTIAGFAELLLTNNNLENNSKQLLYSRQIFNSANNLLTLLDNLVGWAKSQTQEIITYPTNLNIAKLINGSISIFVEMAASKNISIENECNPVHTVFADKNTLDTAIRNIINNALKFTDNGGRLCITSEIVNNQIYLHFQDNGVGINSHDIPLLFDTKIDRDKIGLGTHKNKGTGIGLVITQEFIKLNKGKIEVQSVENEGTCFTICLPTTDSLIA